MHNAERRLMADLGLLQCSVVVQCRVLSLTPAGCLSSTDPIRSFMVAELNVGFRIVNRSLSCGDRLSS